MSFATAMLLFQEDYRSPFSLLFSSAFGLVFWALLIVVLIGMWKMFVKAGQPGWACIVPIYNVYVLCKIAGRPGWWVLLYFIPIVSLVIAIIVCIDIAKAFGQGAAFGFFLNFLLGGIGFLILGFGNYQYLGPQTQTMTAIA